MSAAQIHLALNHVPLFLSLAGGLILILGAIKENNSYINLAFFMLLAAALFTAPVFLTGEGSEEMVEHLPGVNEGAIEEHEEMAKIALFVIIASGVVALAGLLLRKKAGLARITVIAAIILSLASFGAMAKTASLGGKIRHTELGTAGTGEAGSKEQEKEEEEEKGKINLPASNSTQPAPPDSTTTVNEKPVKRDDDDDD